MERAITVVLLVMLAGTAIPAVRDDNPSNNQNQQGEINELPADSVAGGHDYPTGYFRSPIGIPILLAGSFAELRSNHFHSGIDIKTNGKQGYRVYAAADGYIVRILVSPFGNGNALYIRHPNGYTTVYVHLRNFAGPIQEWVRGQQYKKERFAVDLFPDASQFPIKKGEVIALSGNTGGSGGPHLHFEIRDSASEWPVNPLLFGIKVADSVPPQIRKIKMYALDRDAAAVIRYSNGRSQEVTHNRPALLQVAGNGSSYELAGVRSISAIGGIGFGIETRDTHNGSQSRLGPYRVSLFVDDSPVFEYLAEKFSFSNTRYINAHVDFAEHEENHRWVQRSFLLPGNKLPSYRNVVNNGIIEMGDGERRSIRYEVVDEPGNTSTLTFSLDGDRSIRPSKPEPEPAGEMVRYGVPTTIMRPRFKAEIPAEAFYEDTPLAYSSKPGDAETFSDRHVLGDASIPVHERIELSIEATSLPATIRRQSALGYVDSEGKVSFQSAKFEDGWVSSRIRTLGQYFVTADTIDPIVEGINIADGSDLSRSGNIRVKIWDSETGIDSYRGEVDGKWVLFEYDPKARLLTYTFDDRVPRGSHTLTVTATDNVGNRKVFKARFRR